MSLYSARRDWVNRRLMMVTVVESFVWTAKVYREAEQVEVRIEVHDDGVHVATVAGWDDFQLLETNPVELHRAIEAALLVRYPEQTSLLFIENGDEAGNEVPF
jgi:hypothetical protein